jgi:hypothetical protein
MRTPARGRRQGVALIIAGAALPIVLWLGARWLFGGWGLPFLGTPGLCMLSVVGPIVACIGLVIALTNGGAAGEKDDEPQR